MKMRSGAGKLRCEIWKVLPEVWKHIFQEEKPAQNRLLEVKTEMMDEWDNYWGMSAVKTKIQIACHRIFFNCLLKTKKVKQDL